LTTWNCFGTARSLRSALRWRGVVDAHRFTHPSVQNSLITSDVLCMQEVFLSEVEELFDGLAHPHKIRDSNKTELWPLTLGGSGLALASRYPIVSSSIAAFPSPQCGSERFARKGVLYARIRISESVDSPIDIDVLTTHLQSGYDDKASRVRERQLATLRAIVDDRGATDRACIVCGDFNICALSENRREYQRLREVFRDFEDLYESANEATFHPDPDVNLLAHRFEAESPKQRIDYVLYRAPREFARSAPRCEMVFRERLSMDARPDTHASDHFGLRVTFAGTTR
jgi:endonuclease/exonuclease/phosphatase family metal-dependent hydrolase